jgi:DNA-binding protein HU-beta
MPAKRTTHRTSTGKKLYALRNAKGKFKDIETYERAHGQDVKRRAKGEGKRKKKR